MWLVIQQLLRVYEPEKQKIKADFRGVDDWKFVVLGISVTNLLLIKDVMLISLNYMAGLKKFSNFLHHCHHCS